MGVEEMLWLCYVKEREKLGGNHLFFCRDSLEQHALRVTSSRTEKQLFTKDSQTFVHAGFS